MKVSDGRKTKGKIGQKNEKAKLDKEWNKVKNSSVKANSIHQIHFTSNLSPESNLKKHFGASFIQFTQSCHLTRFDLSANICFEKPLTFRAASRTGSGGGNITCVSLHYHTFMRIVFLYIFTHS